MERNSRPYLPPRKSDAVDRFAGTSLSSSLYQPGTSTGSSLITRFPTDGLSSYKPSSSISTTKKYSPLHNSTTATTKTVPNSPYSSRYNTFDRRRSSGIRPPLYSSIRKDSTNTPSITTNNSDYDGNGKYGGRTNDYKPVEGYPTNYSQPQQQYSTSLQFKDEAKKSKSAFKSIRSFIKKRFSGVGKSRERDYSAMPASKRFSSALDINGSLPPYATPMAHRRSTSTSSNAGLPRPASTFSLSRATGQRPASTLKMDTVINPSKGFNHLGQQLGDEMARSLTINNDISAYKTATESRHQMPTWETTKPMRKISTSDNPAKPLSEFQANKATINHIPSSTTDRDIGQQAKHLPLSQPRPSTSDAVSPVKNIEAINSYPSREVRKILQQTADIPCLKGLMNHGNTCYFSAIMQCLTCCDLFAEHFICKGPDGWDKNDDSSLSKELATTLRCLWFNNNSADASCLRTLKLICKEKPQFVISHQQDAHECLIWLLDKLHEEIKEDECSLNHSRNDRVPPLRTHKSEGELAIDALERISGGKSSTIMNIFRGQFRSSMECTNPICGFANLTFDPYLTVSLSIPLPKRPREISVLFIPFFSARQIVRYHFNISDSLATIMDIKERIMKTVNGLPDETMACHILTNGQCQFLPDDMLIDERIKEFTLMEVPKLNEQQQLQDLVVTIVVFVMGIVPDGERYGYPYVAVLNRQWSYDRTSNFLLDKAAFMLPRAFYPLPSDYTLLIQHSAESVACLDPMMAKPLFHDCVNKVLNGDEKILKIIVEWSSSVRHEFNRAPTESIANDYSFLRERSHLDTAREYVDQQIPIPLVNLIEDYVKRETIQDWKCAKCGKSPGRKELKFHSLPDVLIFHLNRFELLNTGVTKKIDSRVQIPIDGLDMSPFVYNPDLRASTLPKHRKERNAMENFLQEGSMLYDLIGVVYHFGERTNSGHYTAATRNPVDSQWRNFDDSRVSQPIESSGEIRVSTKSYLLFYERRKAGKSASNWFPQNVPERIVAKYRNKRSDDDIGIGTKEENGTRGGGGVLMRGSSRFYAGTALGDTQPIPDKPEPRSESVVAGIRVPITRDNDTVASPYQFGSNPYTSSLPRSSIRSASTTPYSTYYASSSSNGGNNSHQAYRPRPDNYRYSSAHKF